MNRSPSAEATSPPSQARVSGILLCAATSSALAVVSVSARMKFCFAQLRRDRRSAGTSQAGGPQAVSVESSIAQFHGSRGKMKPASPHLLSESAIVAGIAKATLSPNPNVPWDDWVADYALIREGIEATWPSTFDRFNQRLFTPRGIERPLEPFPDG